MPRAGLARFQLEPLTFATEHGVQVLSGRHPDARDAGADETVPTRCRSWMLNLEMWPAGGAPSWMLPVTAPLSS